MLQCRGMSGQGGGSECVGRKAPLEKREEGGKNKGLMKGKLEKGITFEM